MGGTGALSKAVGRPGRGARPGGPGIPTSGILAAVVYTRRAPGESDQNFLPPTYRQRKPGFVAGMSAVDLVFNHGPGAREILTSQTEPPYLEWTAASAGASPVRISASDDGCEDETL